MSGAMELSEESLETIGKYVRQNLGEWLKEVDRPDPGDRSEREFQLLGHVVRVEEGLNTHLELTKQGFAQVDTRLQEQSAFIAARFEQVDKRFEEQTAFFAVRFEDQTASFNARFEDQTASFNARFEAQTANFNARFAEQNANIAARFADQAANIAARFEQVDKRFEDQTASIAARFEQVDKRFDDLNRHMNRWMTVMTLMLAVIGIAVTVTNLMG